MWDRKKTKRVAKPQAFPSAIAYANHFTRSDSRARARRREDAIPLAQWFTARHVLALAHLLLLAAALLAIYLGFRLAPALDVFGVRRVAIGGQVGHVDRAELQRVVRGLPGNFLTLDLGAAQRAFEAVPWVRRAAVERTFPDRLSVHIEEHVPLARFAGGGLVNASGEWYAAEYRGALPVFEGAKERVSEIAQRYGEFRAALDRLDLEPVVVALSPRQSWQVKLGNGLTLELGREMVSERLKTFVQAYPISVAQLADTKRTMDFRYANGFVVKTSKRDNLSRPYAKSGDQG